MSVSGDASGRRSVKLEFEVPGTPEEVWKAIATGPGISSWFVPAEFEERDGKPVSVKFNFGPGMEPSFAVTAWNPPHTFVKTSGGYLPGSPPIADEWTVEARAGGTCVVRIVQSLFASTDEWDSQLEGAKQGLAGFIAILKLYLQYFRGQPSSVMKLMAPAAGTEAEAWETLVRGVGLEGLSIGQRVTAPAGAPSLSGVVEYISENPCDALIRIDQPSAGVVALGTMNFPGAPVMVAMNCYFYGEQAHAAAARETPLWQAWFAKRFPMPAAAEA